MDDLHTLSQLIKELQITIQENVVIPNDGYYNSRDVQKRLKISDDTLAKMRAEGRIVFEPISAFSFRYPIDQPLFRKRNYSSSKNKKSK
jgi:hypothetical protein